MEPRLLFADDASMFPDDLTDMQVMTSDAAEIEPLAVAPTYSALIANGPASNRVDIVVLGDGYRAQDMSDGTYAGHTQSLLNGMFTQGMDAYFFQRYEGFFNAYQVNVISNQNGADLGNYGAVRDTALGSTYFYDGVTERLLYVNHTLTSNAMTQAFAGTGITGEMRFVTVNDTKYGGGGGYWAVYAGANSSAREIALHEVAHSFAGLADEYFYTNDTYTGSEPSNPNTTKRLTQPYKWDRWAGYVDPNTNIGTIGYYQGAAYCTYGIYRPSDNSKMRSLGRPFDAVSREAYIKKIYDYCNPLDGYRSNASTLANPDQLWVDSIDPDVISVQWYVDGELAGTGESLQIAGQGLSEGTHTIRARAYDTILDHSFSGDAFDWWRLPDDSPLEQEVSWSVTISAPPVVSQVTVNDGAPQRSMVNEILVVFSRDVTLTNAVSLLDRSGSVAPGTSMSTTMIDGRSYRLTFSGSAVTGGSLADGLYRLTISAAGVSDLAGNAMAANYSMQFHRLFGDSDGDRDVDASDLAQFRRALKQPAAHQTYAYFDFDGDGSVSLTDLAEAKARSNRRLLK